MKSHQNKYDQTLNMLSLCESVKNFEWNNNYGEYG